MRSTVGNKSAETGSDNEIEVIAAPVETKPTNDDADVITLTYEVPSSSSTETIAGTTLKLESVAKKLPPTA